MTAKILKTMFFVMVLALPTTVFAHGDGEKKDKMNHEMHEMKSGMKHDMASMKDHDMKKMHARMSVLISQLQDSPQKTEMMAIHQKMTQVMEKMKMKHKTMKHDMHDSKMKTEADTDTEKKHEHNK